MLKILQFSIVADRDFLWLEETRHHKNIIMLVVLKKKNLYCCLPVLLPVKKVNISVWKELHCFIC